jgi:hypothetical protein
MKQVDELIRGELSAIQSFDAVLDKIKDQSEREKLSAIRTDHVHACDKLRQFAAGDIEGRVEDSGPWGSFSKAFAGGASLFGDKAAIKALKVGEEHGLNEYKEALNNNELKPELRQVIQSELLPQQERHLSMIDGYIQ